MRRILAGGLSMALVAGCGPRRGAEQVEMTTAAATSVTELTLEYSIPAQLALQDVAFVAYESADVADGAQVTRADRTQYPSIGNLGAGQLRVGVGSGVGQIASVGSVFLAERAHVYGDITTAGSVQKQSTWTIDGTSRERETVAERSLSRKVPFPAPLAPGRTYQCDEKSTTALPPGGYQSLILFSRSRARLVAGEYFLDKLQLEPQAELVIDDSSGPVFVYVRQEMLVKGVITGTTNAVPRVLFGFFGAGEVLVTTPFRGTLVAPQATINLETIGSDAHKGSFFGRIVRVAPGVRVELQPFTWLIQDVKVSRTSLCPGESVDVEIVAADPSGSGQAVAGFVNGMPGARRTVQLPGAAGQRAIAVAATSGGVTESRIVYTNVVACGTENTRPILAVAPNIYHRDTVDFVVVNRGQMPAGATYTWQFGDGTGETTEYPTATHSYAAALPADRETVSFETSVTVNAAAGGTWSTGATTITVVNGYAMNARLGLISPPIEPATESAFFTIPGTRRALFEVGNREPVALTFSSYRLIYLPCDENSSASMGFTGTMSLTVPAGGSARDGILFLEPPAAVCGVALHLEGQTAGGKPAMSSTYFDLDRPRATRRASAGVTAVLKALAAAKLIDPKEGITNEEYDRLARQGQVQAVTRSAGSPVAPAAADACDPVAGEPLAGTDCDPDAAPTGNLTCQASFRDWNVVGEGEVVNGLKGDLLTTRRCGFAAEMFQALTPQQYYTHIGVMDTNRTRVRHSTAWADWVKEHKAALGLAGFQEKELRYQWPGAVTFTAYEAFETGKRMQRPDKDETANVAGFNKSWRTCAGDTVVAFPLLIKPPPADEATTRPRLNAVADAARGIEAHYRLFGFTDAAISAQPSYSGPSGDGWGGAATVCTSFVRQAAVNAGIRLDAVRDEPENHTGTPTGQTADGLYYYSPDDRLAAAMALWAFIHNEAASAIDEQNFGIDELIGLATDGQLDLSDTLLATVPVQMANQVVNCFALDRCSPLEATLPLWTMLPRAGVAVSDDDIVRFWDTPAQGGGYGYHEQLMFRPTVARARTCWAPSSGSGSMRVHVVDPAGQPVIGAVVTLRPANGTTARATEAWPNTTPDVTDDAAAVFGAVPDGDYEVDAVFQVSDPSQPATGLPGRAKAHVDAGQTTVVIVPLTPPNIGERRVTMLGTATVEYHDVDHSAELESSLDLTTANPSATTGMPQRVCYGGRRRLLVGMAAYSLSASDTAALVAAGVPEEMRTGFQPGSVAVKVTVTLKRNLDCITGCKCSNADNTVTSGSGWFLIPAGGQQAITGEGAAATMFWGGDEGTIDVVIYNDQLPAG